MGTRDRFLLTVLQFVEALNFCFNKRKRSFLLFLSCPSLQSVQLIRFLTRSHERLLEQGNTYRHVTVCNMYVLLTFQAVN